MNNKKIDASNFKKEKTMFEIREENVPQRKLYLETINAIDLFEKKYTNTVIDQEMIILLSKMIKSIAIEQIILYNNIEGCECDLERCTSHNLINFIKKINDLNL
jgi:hypothetical protein